ncbi:PepSY domain-containing protein [Thalassotalea euphylliae]|uniref:PepSY domain-containing protein n=1 Tax=Thalassotalea euphylliae TaxID=1655234 RepID=A0A3E0TM22_9GAMM|nr:PepSY-associated TM helix domain-containing protein [Thalassotalea euphylliae]REL25609.1 PepSY domain-containing protein [Thalassotalea euphylliae]
MKSATLKNALNAHGWVGLIISLPLFIVFWAGAITLFHPEIDQWAKLLYYDIDTQAKSRGETVDYNDLVEAQIAEYGILAEDRISLRFPNEKMPYLRMFFQVPVEEGDTITQAAASHQALESNGESEGQTSAPTQATEKAPAEDKKKVKKEFKDILIDPHSGEVFTDHSPFELADFLYVLHYKLHLPQGLYIVGVITLFFFVIIITGVIVQLKKIVKNFFLYRKDQKLRTQMNDMHNVVGVISLPYAIMYALTGVILNLLILVQIPSALVLYKGDLDAIAKDAGFYAHRGVAATQPQLMPNLHDFVADLERTNNAEITGLNLYGYGDKSAVFQTIGLYNQGFNHSFSRFYEVATDSYPDTMNVAEDNVFARGLSMLYAMHFANYAGTDMRIIYFVLAMLFCAMIVAGNVLWVVKRQPKNAYPKTLAFTRGATLGACLGVITATALSFFLERSLPEAISEREHLIEYVFGATLLLVTIAGFFANNLRGFIGANLLASAVLLLLTVAFEWLVFGKIMIAMITAGYPILGHVSAGLAIIAILLLAIARKVLRPKRAVDKPLDNYLGAPHEVGARIT